MVDVKAIQEQAAKEITEEVTKEAVRKLKDLYQRKEKAKLVLKNIDREIESYLADIEEVVTYEAAGVDTTKG